MENTQDNKQRRLYQIDDIREIFSCGRGTAYAILHSSGFPKMQVGRKLYVQPAELEKWLKANQGKEVAI
jgi:hypothetical protein